MSFFKKLFNAKDSLASKLKSQTVSPEMFAGKSVTFVSVTKRGSRLGLLFTHNREFIFENLAEDEWHVAHECSFDEAASFIAQDPAYSDGWTIRKISVITGAFSNEILEDAYTFEPQFDLEDPFNGSYLEGRFKMDQDKKLSILVSSVDNFNTSGGGEGADQ